MDVSKAEKGYKELERVLKAVANRRRLLILKHLKEHQEASVSEIAKTIKLSFKATSKHLGLLCARDIIEKEQRGLRVYYCLSAFPHKILQHILDVL